MPYAASPVARPDHGNWCQRSAHAGVSPTSELPLFLEGSRTRRPHRAGPAPCVVGAPGARSFCVSVDLVLKRTLPQASVLEVGAELYSVLLPWLYQYGYRNLTGIDLVHRRVIRCGPIICEPGDLTRTRFPDATFDVIGSLSVIEHGVPLGAYFSEMWRLVRPGGMLITSTDYWHEPVDPRGQTAYDVPIRVFTSADIDAMIALAERHGFRLTGPLGTVCDERAVTWKRYGLSYTYISFALERE